MAAPPGRRPSMAAPPGRRPAAGAATFPMALLPTWMTETATTASVEPPVALCAATAGPASPNASAPGRGDPDHEPGESTVPVGRNAAGGDHVGGGGRGGHGVLLEVSLPAGRAMTELCGRPLTNGLRAGHNARRAADPAARPGGRRRHRRVLARPGRSWFWAVPGPAHCWPSLPWPAHGPAPWITSSTGCGATIRHPAREMRCRSTSPDYERCCVRTASTSRGWATVTP